MQSDLKNTLSHGRQWRHYEQHRDGARSYSLAVLVWGPAPSNSIEYRKRCEIRDALKQDGHDAAFSEDLIGPDPISADPLDEELLQADAADLIVVLYGSRGTQTEIDVLLGYPRFADKSLIFIHDQMYENVRGSVAKGLWAKLGKYADVVKYTTEQMEACEVVARAHDKAELYRRAAYIDAVKEKAGRL